LIYESDIMLQAAVWWWWEYEDMVETSGEEQDLVTIVRNEENTAN